MSFYQRGRHNHPLCLRIPINGPTWLNPDNRRRQTRNERACIRIGRSISNVGGSPTKLKSSSVWGL